LKSLFRFLCILVLTILVGNDFAYAQGQRRISFIRDAEIETALRLYATPLFQAAGLAPEAVKIFIVRDKSLNAFVAGGQKLFMNTGLLMQAKTAGQVIGVIAHETGHIAGGHLTRIQGALKKSSAQTIAALILGGAAAVLGQSELGQAIIIGGQTLGTNSFLHYTRTQENSADQAAMRLLEGTHQSAQGLYEFMGLLEEQELVSPQYQDAYMRTHPVTRSRMKALEAHMSNSAYSKTPIAPELQAIHRRIRAKLYAYLEPVSRTMRRYKKSDRSIEARYARAVAYHKGAKLDDALKTMSGLLTEHPKDPYFLELMGQILFESGRIRDSLPYYTAAVKRAPSSALMRGELAHAQIETNNPALLQPAISNLRAALRVEREIPNTWRALATAYGRQKNDIQASLALAEEALLLNKKTDALHFATRAKKQAKEGTPAWLQADDILAAAKRLKAPE
jgi:predicted Zn-dependent protease